MIYKQQRRRSNTFENFKLSLVVEIKFKLDIQKHIPEFKYVIYLSRIYVI